MLKQLKEINIKFRIIFLLFIKLNIIDKRNLANNNYFLKNITKYINIRPFSDLFNRTTIKEKTILIIELNKFHHECTPGYSKYFLDLGFKVDNLMHTSGIDSFSLFREIKNVNFLTFDNLNQIEKNSKNLSLVIRKYDFILLQSTNIKQKKLYIELGLLNKNNTFFVFHEILFNDTDFIKYFNQKRIWALGRISKGLVVNPHFFGDIKIKDKNDKTKFFMTSTIQRNYKNIIESAYRLKEENFNFEIIITGRSNIFNSKNIPNYLKENFIFKHFAPYSELYQSVINSDYIIIPLDPKDENDKLYKNVKVTGSIQLVYGFLKPPIINQEFADFYNLSIKNSLLYNDFNLFNIMRKAILLDNKDYKKLQRNIKYIEKDIYKLSINNIKNVIHN